MDVEIVKSYLYANKELYLIDGYTKKPLKSGWNKFKESQNSVLNHAKNDLNLAWRLSHGDLVLDVDPRNGGDISLKKLCDKFKVSLIPTVLTPSGGYHYYFQMPDKYIGLKFLKDNKDYPGIEFLCRESISTASVLIAGCKVDFKKVSNNGERTGWGYYKFYDEIYDAFTSEIAPKWLLDEFLRPINKTEFSSVSSIDVNNNLIFDDIDGGVIVSPAVKDILEKPSKERVLEALNKLSPDVGYSEWVKIGMMLQDSGLPDWFEVWQDWSKGGASYEDGCCEKASKGFNNGDGLTIASLFYLANNQDNDDIDIVNELCEKISNASAIELRRDIITDIKKRSFDKIDLEKLAVALQNRFRVLSNGQKFSKGAIIELIKRDAITGELIRGRDGILKPDWCDKWVYVVSRACFLDTETLREHKCEAFNVINGKNVPSGVDGGKPSAVKFIMDNGFVTSVSNIGYFPTNNDLFVIYDNEKTVNVFNHKKRPIKAKEYTKEGLEYIEILKKHINIIFMDVANAEIFTCWLAHQVQFPGKKILWAPVIQSFQGLGKTFFRELLEYCLGKDNVGVVSSSSAISDFNGWACRRLVNVIEELKISNTNGHLALNALKPLITDSSILINEKGVNAYKINNTVNYLCFTNFKNALPVDEGDRRWWIHFSPFENEREFLDYVGEDAPEYFARLFDGLSNNAGEVLKWLQEYNITNEFLSIKRAPDTDAKRRIIATREAAIEGLLELKNLINEGGEFYNNEVVSSSDLFNDFCVKYPNFNLGDHKNKHYLLTRLGFTKIDKQISIKDKMRRIWTKKDLSVDKIRDLLLAKKI